MGDKGWGQHYVISFMDVFADARSVPCGKMQTEYIMHSKIA